MGGQGNIDVDVDVDVVVDDVVLPTRVFLVGVVVVLL